MGESMTPLTPTILGSTMVGPRKLTPFDRLGLKEGGLIVAVRQMDGLHAALKQQEILEIQRKREREQNERQVKAKP
jgi:hypothetical protein